VAVVTLLNQKGGVGKTSTTHHLAGTLALMGRRVLLLDNDPQASLSQGLWGPVAARGSDPAAMRNLAALPTGQGRTAEAESWNRYADAIAVRPAAYRQPAGYHAHPTRPPHAYPPAHGGKPPVNSLAIYAVSMGAVGLITCGLPSIPAIVAGHIAWVRVRRSGERGLGLAVTGIALGWIMVAFWALVAFGWSLPDET